MKWRNWIIFFMQNLTFAYRSKDQRSGHVVGHLCVEHLTKPRSHLLSLWVDPAGLQASCKYYLDCAERSCPSPCCEHGAPRLALTVLCWNMQASQPPKLTGWVAVCISALTMSLKQTGTLIFSWLWMETVGLPTPINSPCVHIAEGLCAHIAKGSVST